MSQRQNNSCGPNCRFKTLYEGSQSSLADMAGNHASQSRRVGQLRQGVISILRAAAPRRFNELEKHLGCRVTEVDDDTFLSSVQWILEPQRDEITLSMLRAELCSQGYPWASDTSPKAILTSVKAGQAQKAEDFSSPVVRHEVSPVMPKEEEVEPDFSTLRNDLDSLFDDPVEGEGEHAECGKPETKKTPPKKPTKKKTSAKASKPEQGALDVDSASMLSGLVGEPSEGEESPKDSSDNNESTVPVDLQASDSESEEPTAPQSDGEVTEDEAVEVLGEMFDAEPEQESFVTDDFLDSADEDFGSFDDLEADFLTSDGTSGTNTVETPSETPDEQIDTAPEPEPEPEQVSAPEAPKKVVRTANDRFMSAIPTGGAAVSKTSPKKPPKRERKVSATPPEALGSAPVSDDVTSKLRATASIQRPMFIADLAEQIGDAQIVDDWVEKERAASQNGDSRFSFIHGKDRYSQFGSLVVPKEEEREALDPGHESWWFNILRNFKGARLFELAVLFSTVGNDVTGVTISEDSSAVTLFTESIVGQGAMGIVVSTTIDGQVSESVVSQTLAMIEQQLSLVLVLHTHDAEFMEFAGNLTSAIQSRHSGPAVSRVAAMLNRHFITKNHSEMIPVAL